MYEFWCSVYYQGLDEYAKARVAMLSDIDNPYRLLQLSDTADQNG